MEARIAPSARIEESIEEMLLGGLDDPDRLSELGRLGAQLVIQRAVEEEVTAFLGRARYERTAMATGSRNGTRPRRVQTAEGEITIAVPQVRDSLTRFVSAVIPDTKAVVRTRPLEALVIGAYVRGLSDRDIESLAREAGLGTISKTTVSTVCRELRDRYRAFRARSLGEVRLLALMLDAIYLPTRPEGPKEGVLVAWGFTTEGERVLLDVCLGQRERLTDWLELGRGLTTRGLRGPLLVVADGAPGLIRAIGELWPEADRQRCSVHRLRNVLAKLPKRDDLQARVRAAYWAALDGATSPAEAEQGLRALVGELSGEFPSAAACLAEDLPALTVHLAYPLRLKRRLRSTNLLERSLASEQLLVPGAGDLVEREAQGASPLDADVEEDDRHLVEPFTPGGLEPLVARDDDPAFAAGDDRLDEAELADAQAERIEGRLIDDARVGGVVDEGVERGGLDGEGGFCDSHRGLLQAT